MTPTLDNNLKTAHEIGSYIALLTTNLDKSDGWGGGRWAAHHFHFQTGPDPSRHQLIQGLILEVANADKKPQAVHMRCGHWKILGASHGSFDKIFATLQITLHLKKIEAYKNPHLSLWAIQRWKGQALPNPVRASRRADEYIPHHECVAAYKEFKNNMTLLNQKMATSVNCPGGSAGKPPTLPKPPSCSMPPVQKPPSTVSVPPKNSEQTTNLEGPTQLSQATSPPDTNVVEVFPVLPRPRSYRPPNFSTPSPYRQPWHASPKHAMRDSAKAQHPEKTKSSSVPPTTPSGSPRDFLKGPFSIRIISSPVVLSPSPRPSQKAVNTILVKKQPTLPKPRLQKPTLTLKPTTSQEKPISFRPETSPWVPNNAIQVTIQPPISKRPVQKIDTGEYSPFTVGSDTSEEIPENTSPVGWQPLFHSPRVFGSQQSPETFE